MNYTIKTFPLLPMTTSTIPAPPFDINGIDESPTRLHLTYQNDNEDTAIKRTYHRSDGQITESTEEWSYNYLEQQWERAYQFNRTYELADDNRTLVGDGSGWDGNGHYWKHWFKKRHYELLEIRFQYAPDDITVPAFESSFDSQPEQQNLATPTNH